VERYWAAHDAGRIINPVAAEGQVIGGVHQGLGFALTESLAVGSDGTVLNPGFLDDRVPTSADAVPIEVMFVDTSEPNGPDGSKSIAEPPIIPVAACVANAIYDAVGVRPLHTPMTSERTWRQLRLKDLRAHGAKP
jgi:xanthine dehydrogenase molybdenum-binding subunit